ncbi:hypothetical protein [Streptomyces sp. NPDC003032]
MLLPAPRRPGRGALHLDVHLRGPSRSFATEDGGDRTAWRPTHSPLFDQLEQKVIRLLRLR